MIPQPNFTPFYGFVEDVSNDPLKLGRIRVRVAAYHTQNTEELPTNSLLWFSCVVNNSESLDGVGTNPKYKIGSAVFGYFIDSTLQNGIVVGSIPGIKQSEKNEPTHDINRLARNEEIDQTVVQSKKDGVREDVEKTDGSTWSEPQTPYNAVYPQNKVTESDSGHISEVDDTEGFERLHVYHRSGSFYEIHPDGSQVVKIVKDDYNVVMGDDFICIEGDVSKYIGGNDDLVVGKNQNIKIKGNQDATVAGTRTHDVEGKDTLRAPQIQLGEDDAVEPSVLGNQLAKWIETELVPWLNTHNHIGNLGFPTSAAANGPVGPFDPGEGAKEQGVYSKVNTNQ